MTAHPKPVVVKDPAYLAYVRTLPCLNALRGCQCGETIGKGPSEASHLQGKSRDDLVVPMCGRAHRTGPHAWHQGKQTFLREWGWTEAQLLILAHNLYHEWKTR